MIRKRTLKSLKREFDRSSLAKLGVSILLLMIIAAVFAPVIAPHDPLEQNLNKKNQPPVGISVEESSGGSVFDDTEESTNVDKGTWNHLLGTNPLGQDVLSRTIYGARISFLVGIVSTLIGFVVGTVAGLASGYFRGLFDDILMRIIDIRLSIPGLILAIVILALFGSLDLPIPDPIVMMGLAPGMPDTILLPMGVTIAIGVLSWDEFARVARSEALSLREEEYVKASHATGAGSWHIIRNHLFPNAVASVMILATIRVATAILLESTLAYLGFTSSNISWGFDIAMGQNYLATSWWVAMVPGIAIALSVIGVNLIGDWLRDALDPSTESNAGGL